ncbi:MAG: efflux RND transporter periplasmic adaptor subunit [Gemmatimonadota bacterium]
MTQNILITSRRRLGHIALALLAFSMGACSDDEAPSLAAGEEQHDEHGDEHADEDGADGRVELTEAAIRNAGIEVAEVAAREVSGEPSGAAVPGQVEFDPSRVVLVSPRTGGRIERLTAVEGDQVRAGQPLAYVLSSAFLTAQNDFLQSVRRAQVLAGTGDEEGARALAEAARRRLRLLGATDALVERLAGGGDPLDLLPIGSPIGGSIVEAHSITGAAVEAGSPIYTVADLSVVNVVAEVPERALSTLRRGQTADVRLSAYPDERVQGTVDRIREELDPSTRTARAVIRVPNPRRLLRPGMFASVALSAGAAAPREMRPVIPESAVVTDGAERYVFVEVAPRTFERRTVDVAPLGGGELLIRSGIAAGERIVIRGAFTLQSELGKAEFGGHAH